VRSQKKFFIGTKCSKFEYSPCIITLQKYYYKVSYYTILVENKNLLLIAYVIWPVDLLSEDVSSREDAPTSWPSSSGLSEVTGSEDLPYHFESADNALLKMVRYVFLRPLRPELDGRDVEASSREDMLSSSI
jgi:hypothetical protein